MATNGPSRIQSLRIMAYVLMGSLVVIGSSLVQVLEDPFAPPPLLAVVVVLAFGAAALALVTLIGYRLPPLPAGTPPDEASRLAVERYQTGLYVRFALCEAPAIVSLGATFALADGSILVFVLGAVIALALMSVHVLPGQGNIERTRQALERDGATSRLREGLEGGVS